MTDGIFDKTLDEPELASVVADWLLSKYGLRVTESALRISRDGVEMRTASVRAQACSTCEPDLYVKIRRHMDSKLVNRDCDKCGERRLHAAFLADKADRLVGG